MLAAGRTAPVTPRLRSGLWWFVALSLLLHLGLLWQLPQFGQDIPLPRSESLYLRLEAGPVQLTTTGAHSLPASETSRRNATISKRPVHIAPKAEPRKVISAMALPGSSAMTNTESRQSLKASKDERPLPTASSTERGSGDKEELHRQIKNRLRASLNRYFQYPRLAQRRGWQGQVVLGFSLRGDGRIDNAHVAHSSGYAVLDRAALNALGKVKRIDLAPRSETSMQLPVIYQLHEG